MDGSVDGAGTYVIRPLLVSHLRLFSCCATNAGERAAAPRSGRSLSTCFCTPENGLTAFSLATLGQQEPRGEDDPFLFARGGCAAAVWGSGSHPVAFPVFVNYTGLESVGRRKLKGRHLFVFASMLDGCRLCIRRPALPSALMHAGTRRFKDLANITASVLAAASSLAHSSGRGEALERRPSRMSLSLNLALSRSDSRFAGLEWWEW